MRSAAIAAFAGFANAGLLISSPVAEYPVPEATEYSTAYVTIVSCAPEVTNCPADSTVVESSLVPLTTSTVYETRVHTISKCGAEVTDCPYASGGVETVYETIAVSTTVCPVSEAEPTPTSTEGEDKTYPPVSPPTKSAPVPEESKPAYPPPGGASSSPVKPHTSETEKPHLPTSTAYPVPPVPTKPAEEDETCETVSVKTVTRSTQITTVINTVVTEYETATLEVPCPEPTQPGKTSDVPVPPPHVPTGGNGTVPAVPSSTSPVEAGAAGISGSVLVAFLGAAAALVFAQ